MALTSQPKQDQNDANGVRAKIGEVARRYRVPQTLAIRVAALESNFDPKAESSTGAKGLFQLLSPAVRDVRNKYPDLQPLRPFDVVSNATYGVLYLAICADYMGRDIDDEGAWPVIYAAYNIGAGNVRRLLTGHVDDNVRSAIALQAKAYSRGGPAKYLANVASALARAA